MTEATNNTGALLPCPFCGSTDVEIDGKPAILDALDSVSCNQCTAGAPIHAWQGRTTPPAAAVVPEADEIHQMAFEEGQPAENGDGYLFTAEEFDLFVERLLARLNPAPDHSEHALGMVPADHVEHVRAMVVPEGWWQIIHDTLR